MLVAPDNTALGMINTVVPCSKSPAALNMDTIVICIGEGRNDMAKISQYRIGYKNQVNEAGRAIMVYMCMLSHKLMKRE